MNTDQKLDKLLANQNEMFTELRVHIAKDEDMWRRVEENEEDIKRIASASTKLSKRQAALLASLSGGVATVASLLTKVLQ